MSNLLPCPFCGWEAQIKTVGGTIITVVCQKCSASSDVLRTRAAAIAAWNTRHTPAPSNTQQAAAAVLAAQEAKGVGKYGTTLDNAGLSLLEHLQHLQQELADALMYVTAAIEALKKEASNDK